MSPTTLTPAERSTSWHCAAHRCRTTPNVERVVLETTTTKATDRARDIRAGRVEAFRPTRHWRVKARKGSVYATYVGP